MRQGDDRTAAVVAVTDNTGVTVVIATGTIFISVVTAGVISTDLTVGVSVFSTWANSVVTCAFVYVAVISVDMSDVDAVDFIKDAISADVLFNNGSTKGVA